MVYYRIAVEVLVSRVAYRASREIPESIAYTF